MKCAKGLRHYGIWVTVADTWMMDDSGIIFWTTSRAVAEAQLRKTISSFSSRLEVKEFIDTPEEQQQQ